MEQALLEFKDVSFSYHSVTGEVPVLSHISFQAAHGDFLAIVGPGGCGKSTILDLICGLFEPMEGKILLNGTSLQSRSLNIGCMLQRGRLFEWRTIYSNLPPGPEIRRRSSPGRKADEFNEFRSLRPSQLSGGMRQKAALLRTLAPEPDLLLLDDPFAPLDRQTRLNVANDIGTIIKQEAKTAILVTNDIAEAISMADHVLVLSSRPAIVRCDLPIRLSIPDRTPLRSRNAPEFETYFHQLRKTLDTHD